MTKVESTDDWMYDEGRDVGASVYREKLTEVKGLAGPIFLRMSELEEREKAVESARKTLSDVTTLVKKWNITMPWVTEEEKKEVWSKTPRDR